MKTEDIQRMMQHISPRYTEEAAQRAASAKPRPAIMPTLTVLASAALCMAAVGGVVYLGHSGDDLTESGVELTAEDMELQTDPAPADTGTQITEALATDDAADWTDAPSAEQSVTTAAQGEDVSAATSAKIITVVVSGTAKQQTAAVTTAAQGSRTTAAKIPSIEKRTAAAIPERATTTRNTTAATTQSAATTTQQTTHTETQMPATYELGDLDRDGYLTLADYMLAAMYEECVTRSVNISEYPQILTGSQIEDFYRLEELVNTIPAAQNAQYPFSYQGILNLAVQERLQSVSDGSATEFGLYPERIGAIWEEDRAYAASGNFEQLSVHAKFLAEYYISQYREEPCYFTVTRYDEAAGKKVPFKFSSADLDISSEQVDAFLAFLRQVSIDRYTALSSQSTMPGDVDGDGYITYADVMLLSLKWNMVFSGADRDAYVIYPQALTAEQIERGNIDKTPSTYYESMSMLYDSADEIPIDGIDVAYLTNYVSYVMRGNDVSLEDYLADYDTHMQNALADLQSGQASGVTSADVYNYLEQHPENICKPCELDDSIIAGGDYAAFVNRIQMIVWHYALDIRMQSGNTVTSADQTYPVITSDQFDAFAAYLREVCIARYEALGK